MSLTPHSMPREGRSPNASLKPSPKPSSESLKKQAISPPGGHKSALTAAIGSPGKGAMDSDIPSIPSPAAFDFNKDGPGSGATTPKGPGGADDSGWSNLGEIPDERKAQVLRRHLVSAEEREHSKAGTPTATSPGNASPIGEGGPSGGPGDSAVTYGSTTDGPSQVDDRFPIPFDALGGDVT
jgi:proton-coupled amino acid transporter